MNVVVRHVRFLVLFGWVWTSAFRAGAQPGGGQTYHSLEARIAESREVFFATVTNFEEHEPGTNGASGCRGYLNVSEVLKGKVSGWRIKFEIEGVSQCPEFRKWAAEQVPFLWLVSGSEDDIGQEFFAGVNYIFLGSPEQMWKGGLAPEYASDMALLTDPKEIRARARAFAKRRLDITKFHTVWLADLSSRTYFNLRVVLPVEPSLERTAKRLLAAPDQFISAKNNEVISKRTDAEALSDWRCEYRAEGVSALQYFKSPANIKLLKSLLDDPSYWEVRYQPPGVSNMVNRIYEVRQNAYDVLHGWGIDVLKPVTSEVVPKKAERP